MQMCLVLAAVFFIASSGERAELKRTCEREVAAKVFETKRECYQWYKED
jgi:hypothetical protein